MAKTKGGKNKKNGKFGKKPDSDSDNDHYADNDEFDPKNPFDGDEIEKFHSKRDDNILDSLKPKGKKPFLYSSDEEEVLALSNDDDTSDDDIDDKVYGGEDDEENDDEENNNELDYDGPNSSWGNKKSSYYSGNKIANDEDAELEEEEAKALQEKLMKQLDTNDFGLDAFKIKKNLLKTSDELAANKLANEALGLKEEDFDEESLQKISQNLSKMSKKEKLEFLKQESPELIELIRDFKEKLNELQETLLYLFKFIKSGQIPHSNASDFIINKTKLYLMYCCHLNFYFILKSERLPVENHPIIKNILQFRNLCKQLNGIDEKLNKEVKFLIDSIKNNRQLSFLKSSNQIKKVNFKLKPKRKESDSDDMDEDLIKDEEEMEKSLIDLNENQQTKRAINYQISKNKGLTPKRNKMYRNPRIRNRVKAQKALVKRKSIIPKVRSQEKRYTGEATGIRTGVVRGVKIK